MSSGLLVLASRYVGRELIAYLVDRKVPMVRVIIARQSDQAIAAIAESAGIDVEIYGPDTQNTLVKSSQRYKWLLNLWSPHILSIDTLALADRRLNVHPSLVPHCRGNDNAAWAVRNGSPAGVSLIEMGAAIDGEGVYAQSEVENSFPTTGKEMHETLQEESVRLFKSSWPDIYSGATMPTPQVGEGSYFRRRDTNRDRVMDGDVELPVEEFITWALAHDFDPGTTAEVSLGGKRYRIRVAVDEIDPDQTSGNR